MEKEKKRIKTTPEIISQRKFELIKRDPLAIELDELVRGKREDNTSWREVKRRFPHYDGVEIQEHGLSGILERELIKKWNISPYPTGKLDRNIPFSWLGIFPAAPNVYDLRKYINEILLPDIKIELTYSPEQQKHFEKHGWIYKPGVGGYEKDKTVSIWIPRDGIPIWINPYGLTEKSREKITKQIWDILKDTIHKRKTKNSKKWQPIPQRGEPPKLGFLYSTGENKFQNYLKWYDLHTQEKIPCRLIAHFDKTYKTNPLKATEILERFKQKKIKWGLSVKGEDKIEKGVKKIFEAIHRDNYSQEKIKPEIVEYNCSQHGNACPQTCTYYKKWLNRFNRLMASN